ncbi:MAG: YbgA family protein [Anaerolineae bacterium]
MREVPKDCQLRLGVSTCLLGERVRYDGGHKLDRFLVNMLGEYVEWVPVCPEVECGLPTPRESMRLVGNPESPRLVAPRSGHDYTEQMHTWAEGRLDDLEQMGLHGFIFKKNSPSSGRFRVRVYNEAGMPSRVGVGLFAQAFVDRFPYLPTEEEGRLNDPRLRENFIDRVFMVCRWRQMLAEEPTPGGLVRFHTGVKLTLMGHSPSHYRALGRLVAKAGLLDWDELREQYITLLMEGMEVLATPGKHANVLQHLMGYLKEKLTAEDKQELLGLIEDYRKGLVPLVVPVTLLKHHLRRHEVPEWVHEQSYLHPYPRELMLRNHV